VNVGEITFSIYENFNDQGGWTVVINIFNGRIIDGTHVADTSYLNAETRSEALTKLQAWIGAQK
jgi:hypothetical protein